MSRPSRQGKTNSPAVGRRKKTKTLKTTLLQAVTAIRDTIAGLCGRLLARKTLGRRGEDLAAAHLKRNGFQILGRNVALGRYEIDIIARENDTVAFVEVKSRRKNDMARPEDNVDWRKRLHIRRAAGLYMEQHGDPDTYYRFDIISVRVPDQGEPDITHFRDAFPDE